jgi:hypothetical protein
MLLEAIGETAERNGHGDAGEPPPSQVTVNGAMNLIADVPFRLLADVDISPFYGEIHLSWNHGPKQIVLMFFPNRTPLIHHHHRLVDAPSEHGIEDASADRLANWLGWLRD